MLSGVLLAMPAFAEMQALDDDTLRRMNGQGGVYLSGEFSINKDGGVLWSKPVSNNPSTWTASQRSCANAGATTPENCGMRVAIRSEAEGGWDVLEFGLPNEVKFKDGSFAFGVANQGGWQNKSLSVANGGNPSYQQTNIFSAKIDGTIRMQGNVLIFPQN